MLIETIKSNIIYKNNYELKLLSKFDNTINFLIQGKTQPNIFTILKNKENVLLSPNSIIISEKDFLLLKQQKINEIIKKNNEIIFPIDYKIKISNEIIFTISNQMKKINLNEIIQNIIKKYPDILSFYKMFSVENIYELFEKFKIQLKQNNFVSYLIGRGNGLTPSGDDILNGYFYMLHINGNILEQKIKSQILNKLEQTTLYSQNMLLYSINKQFSELLIKIYENINNWEELLMFLKEFGHTSGFDTLIGIIFFFT